MKYAPTGNHMSSSEFDEICKEVVGRTNFGYTDVSGEFANLGEHKIKWERTNNWVRFHLSDWFTDAPVDIIRGTVLAVFVKITGREEMMV